MKDSSKLQIKRPGRLREILKPPWLVMLVVLLAASLGGQEVWAQSGPARQRNAYTPVGQRLTSAMVTNELERRMQLNNTTNEAYLWNTGYDFFRNFPQNRDTAQAIKDGYLRARPDNLEQKQILTKAAIYWEKIYLHGRTNVPVGLDNRDKGKVYYGSRDKMSTLRPRPGGSQHQGHPNYDWPGRYIQKRPPYQGRPDNPYPGKYYPGVYPP